MKARLKCTRIQTTQSMILERQSMNDPLQRFFIIISMQLSLRKVFGKLENFSFPFMLLPMILSFILVCVAVLYNCRILKLRLCMRVAWFRKTVFFWKTLYIIPSVDRQSVAFQNSVGSHAFFSIQSGKQFELNIFLVAVK